MAGNKDRVRIAAMADIHCGRTPPAVSHPTFARVSEDADVLLLCGDLTDHGLPEEARLLARELTMAVKIPVIAVLGNHDFHSGKQDEVQKIFQDAGVRVLSGDACQVLGVGFAGVKGFVGGFGRRILEPWGEDPIKHLVDEAVAEAVRLDSALARLQAVPRIALLHYSPIEATVEGEPREIFPFLGCSRLEEPLNRHAVTAAFHGHAHHGKPEGRTLTGVPVYNVSLPLLGRSYPDRPPWYLLEMAAKSPEAAVAARSP
jgi:Icc-related predicted phosphoesterase